MSDLRPFSNHLLTERDTPVYQEDTNIGANRDISSFSLVALRTGLNRVFADSLNGYIAF